MRGRGRRAERGEDHSYLVRPSWGWPDMAGAPRNTRPQPAQRTITLN